MNGLVILAAALLPAILLLYYIWRKDPYKEPVGWLAKAFLWGVAIVIPISVVETAIGAVLFGGGGPTSLVDTTVLSFAVAALPEESFKLLALWLVLRRNPYFDEHFDGIVYAVFVSLGFAAVENVGYVFTQDDWVTTAAMRALLAVPGHYAFAILMGYYYSVHHFVDRSQGVALRILLVPVVAHGIYDSIAMSGMVSPVVGGIAFFLLVYFCVRMHKYAKTKMLAQIEHDRREREHAAAGLMDDVPFGK